MTTAPLRVRRKVRGRGKCTTDYTHLEMYKHYVNTTSDILRLNRALFSKILIDCNSMLADWVINNPGPHRLYSGMGSLEVIKRKQNIASTLKAIDFATSYKIGQRVYHLNDHRNGHIYKIRWNKNRMTMGPYYQFYSFKPARDLARRLAKLLKTKPELDFYMPKQYHIGDTSTIGG